MLPTAKGDTDPDIVYLTGSGGPGSRTITGGLPSLPLEYHLSDFDMNNNREIIINGHVLMRIDGDVDISNLTINAGSSLVLYVHGDFEVSGNGYANANYMTESFVIYGTNNDDDDVEFTLNGSAGLSAAVYAPNADLTVNGGGSGPGFSGAAVAKEIHLNGGVVFHYDEGLDSFTGNDPNFKLKSWYELVQREDRINFESWTTAIADVEAL